MNAAEDRVLEHALAVVFEAPETDLPHKVLRALRDTESTEESAERDGREGSWVLRFAAAAAVLLVALWVVADRSESDLDATTIVARSDEPLGVLRPGSSSETIQREYRIGDSLVNGPEEDRVVTLTNGDTITVGRCAMLTLTEDGQGVLIVPQIGRSTIRAHGAKPLRVRTPLGLVAVDPASLVEVDLVVDGYDLAQPERFRDLAKELHMKIAIPLVMTVATLLEGSAILESITGVRDLRIGEPIQEQKEVVPVERIEGKLLEEVGTWNVFVTNIDEDGKRSEVVEGTEICRAGPGGKWLVTDMTLKLDDREIELHTLIGYDARHRRYTGTLVDNFGGEMGLLRGEARQDLETRMLEMYSAESTPGFASRWRMHWDTSDKRFTQIELLLDDEWILIREIVHERRK